MSKEIKIEKNPKEFENCFEKPLDEIAGKFTPLNEVMKEYKNGVIDIEAPNSEKPSNMYDMCREQIPVGSKCDGIEVVKPQTDIDEYKDESCIFENNSDCHKNRSVLKEYQKDVIKDGIRKSLTRFQLSPAAEAWLRENMTKHKTKEMVEDMEKLSKAYVPKENIDTTKNISDLDIIKTVSKIFGFNYEDATKRYEKLANNGYVKPMCEVKFETGEQPPVYTEVTFDDIANELIELHKRKNNDYGDAAHQSYKEFGITSYVIRLNDKLNRLKALTKPGATMKVQDESIIDTLKDLAAYAIMAIESMSTWR